MNNNDKDAKYTEEVLKGLALVITKTQAVIDAVDDEDIYTYESDAESSIGAHVRHIMDHFENFFQHHSDGRVDFENRARKHPSQNNPKAAKKKFSSYEKKISSLKDFNMRSSIYYQNCTHPSANAVWHRSDRGAVIEKYLIAHTIHHLAMIAMKAKGHGIKISPHLYCAHSTLKADACPG